MKKSTKILIITLIILIVIFIISIPFVNNYTASSIAKKLEKTPLPEKTTYIESVSRAGKMVGNGNGMQYFGAILIESELSADELKEIYSENSQLDVEVSKQDDQLIQCVEHKELFFEHEFAQDTNYYIVYSWGNGIKPFDVLDIRGH